MSRSRDLVEHEVTTVRRRGWTGVKNGELLRRARAAGLDALVTMDRNIEYQEHVAQAGIGIVVLIARSSRLRDLKPLADEVERVGSERRR